MEAAVERSFPMSLSEGLILVVDDDASIRSYLSSLFRKRGLPVVACDGAVEAIAKLTENPVALVLSDIKMPEVSGIELLDQIQQFNSEIPVILMTGYGDLEIAIEAVNKGAFSFLTKPFNQEYLMTLVSRGLERYSMVQSEKNYMLTLENTVMRKTRELEDAAVMANRLSVEIVQRLSAVAEFRDSYTAAHISRIGFYSRCIAEAMNMYKDFIEEVAIASSLHDIGKIGIPDNVLLKKADLTEAEREVMKEHTIMGHKILSGSSHPTLHMASSIALHHHEKWNGEGYPRALKGRDIPIEARIVKLADEYDALRSVRSYKTSLGHQETYRIITEGDGRTSPEHFDPEVLAVFVAISPQFDEIFSTNQD
ncbi:MAG: two-component system response regulator [Thermodesulfovibrio sp.]|nr:two-component system response regulator [Thermodesulfovibrio sp.]